MPDRTGQRHIAIDSRTSRDISRGIGEALRRSIKPSQHPARLQILLDALKAQDEQMSQAEKKRS